MAESEDWIRGCAYVESNIVSVSIVPQARITIKERIKIRKDESAFAREKSRVQVRYE